MGVLIKERDVRAQWKRYEEAQQEALAAGAVFENAARFGTTAMAQEALGKMREAEARLAHEWQEYQRFAPAIMRPGRKKVTD